MMALIIMGAVFQRKIIRINTGLRILSKESRMEIDGLNMDMK